MGYQLLAAAASDPNRLTTGEETLLRDAVTSNNLVTTSQGLRLTFFTARKTETITQLRVNSGGTAAGATPTLVRVGIYLADANSDGTLIASIPNDTTLFAAINAAYTRTLTAPFVKTAGQRYAWGELIVTAAATPTRAGISIAGVGAAAEPSQPPRLTGVLAGQSDLPASFTSSALAATGQRFYGVLLP
ncbi:MAG: hypothetical protein ABW022_08540 [Actinoplanes sp.]